MKILGIITEYNPFHFGHKLHLEKSKYLSNCDGVVCIMSGNYMQRGVPAILNKWDRTDIALANGIDLVIELPTAFSISSAEFFANGAISLLNSLRIVNNICFGSECGNLDILFAISEIINKEPSLFKENLKSFLSLGIPYHKARNLALEEFIKSSDIILNENINEILRSSNNILGIEYIKSLLKSKSTIIPLTFKREGSNYNDKNLSKTYSSATAIRELYFNTNSVESIKNIIPMQTFTLLQKFIKENHNFVKKDEMFSYIKHSLITNSLQLSNIPDINEGIDNKILKETFNSNSLEDLIFRVKSKRYTYTRLSRIFCNIFLGTYSYNINKLRNSKPNYARILGLNENGAKILKLIKKNSPLEIINKVPKNIKDPMLKLDIQATNTYSLLSNNTRYNEDYLRSPIIYK